VALPLTASAPLRFGVLAFRPKAQALAQWQPLAASLEQALGQKIELSAYSYPELESAMAAKAVDVVLTNPGHFVALSHRYHLSAPLVTLVGLEGQHAPASFGGVIFTRADAAGINTLGDLAGKRIATADTQSLGGYQMQAFELLEGGVPLPPPGRLVLTGMPHDKAFEAVLAGRAEVGFVRSGVLEAMTQEGRLDPTLVKVIHRQDLATFPYVSSTPLYPEWPVAVTPQVEDQLARRLTIALLNLQAQAPAARSAGIHGFTVPANYGGVETVLRRLRLPPFDAAPDFTLTDLWRRHLPETAAFAVLLLLLAATSAGLAFQNRRVRQARLHFATLFEHSPEPMWIIADGRFIDCNPAGVHIFGHADKASLLARPADDLSPAHQPDGESSRGKAQRMLGAVAKGEPQRFEWVYLRADGSPFSAILSLTPTTLKGRPVSLAVGHDISDLKGAEESRRLLEAQFHQAMKLESLGSLAGGVAHNMNNVLGAILGLASSLRAQAEPVSPTAKSLDTIVNACLRGRGVVKGLLYFAHKDLQEERAIQLNDLVREMTLLLGQTMLNRVQLELDLEEDLGELRGDAGAVSHALMNLCVNAMDAMPAGGTIWIQTRLSPDGDLVLRVRDSGEGMPPDVLARAMEPFFTTKPHGKGTGLGLSMIYGTMKAHDGRFELKSQPGLGTEAILLFPAARVERRAPAPGLAAGPASAVAPPLTILLVDDDDLIRESVTEVLQFLGHRPLSAPGGQEALRLLEEGLPVDLVILDMNMPVMNGAETLPRVLALRPSLPVLMATGYSDEDILPLLVGRPNVQSLRKPFSIQELADRLAGLRIGTAGPTSKAMT
jgi:PAS domain S-box-containing protein